VILKISKNKALLFLEVRRIPIVAIT